MTHSGDIIRRARVSKGLSGQALGKAANVSKGAVSQWENSEKVMVSGESLLLIAAALDISPELIVFSKTADERISTIPPHVVSLAEKIASLPAADQLLITSMLDHMGKAHDRGSPEIYEKQTTYDAPSSKEQAIKDGYNPDEWEI